MKIEGINKIILGSNSPRRKELLERLDLEFEIIQPNVNESSIKDKNPLNFAKKLSKLKSEAIGKIGNQDLLITADTIIVIDDEIIGKPKNEKQARELLKKISGKKHHVVTGVCFRLGNNNYHTFSESTKVELYPITQEEMDYYIEKYNPIDKAGSYGIQEWIGLSCVKKVEGCYFNVVGLPVPRIYNEIKKLLLKPIF